MSTTTKDLETEVKNEILQGIERRLTALEPKMAKIEESLAPLRAEQNVLLEMRDRVTGSGQRARRKSSGGTRVAHGKRQGEFMAVVTGNPGITVPEIAEKMGIDSNYIYRLRKQAVTDGLVRKEGSKVFPMAAEPAAA